MKNIIITFLFSLIIIGQAQAENMYESSFSIGVTVPKGTFKRYTDNGFYGNGRIIAHLNSFKALSGFADISGSFFKSTDRAVILSDNNFLYDAYEKISEYSIALHIGTLLGSDSRNSFFRPKVGIAGGLYLFNTQTLILDDLFEEKDPLAEDNQTQVKVGWRGIIGTDLFFTPEWGFTFEYTYDQVLNLHHTLDFIPGKGVTTVGQTARFNNYSIGVIFPLPFDNE